MTADEILDKHVSNSEYPYANERQLILDAMNEFAEQFKNKETIEFVRQGCEAFKRNGELNNLVEYIEGIVFKLDTAATLSQMIEAPLESNLVALNTELILTAIKNTKQ